MKISFGIRSTLIVGLIAAGCTRGASLDTQTFRLNHLDENDAANLLQPYVYEGRPNAPGEMSAVEGMLTVRETRDNLAKIERVLAEFDQPRKSVRLIFQVIEANGGTSTDTSIAEVVEELRGLLRFDGYELAAQAVATTIERSSVSQMMYDQRLGNLEVNERMARFSAYTLNGSIGKVSGGDSSVVDLEVSLVAGNRQLFAASIVLGLGHTAVMGTLQLPDNRGLILTVRADLLGN